MIRTELKRLFDITKEEHFGLDIGSSSIKIVQLQKGEDGYTVTAAGIAEIERKSADSAGDLNIIRAIRNCLNVSKAHVQTAVCSVCGPEVAVRSFKFPSLPRDEVAGAVMLEAAQVCPFNVNDSIVDYQLVNNDHDAVKGILVAATEKLVSKKKWFAEEASLKTSLIDVDGLALLNCLREFGKVPDGAVAAVLNVGSTYTTLAIVGPNNMPFVRDIVYGGNDVIARIAEKTNKQPDYIRSVLSSRDGHQADETELAENLVRASQRLVDEVLETIRYYITNEKCNIKDIFLCGGFALAKRFEQLLKGQINANIVVWNPFESIKQKSAGQFADLLREQGPALAVAAGLALRSV